MGNKTIVSNVDLLLSLMPLMRGNFPGVSHFLTTRNQFDVILDVTRERTFLMAFMPKAFIKRVSSRWSHVLQVFGITSEITPTSSCFWEPDTCTELMIFFWNEYFVVNLDVTNKRKLPRAFPLFFCCCSQNLNLSVNFLGRTQIMSTSAKSTCRHSLASELLRISERHTESASPCKRDYPS